MSLDLFGSDVSTNAANYYTAGLKGRFHEAERDDDHRLGSGVTTLPGVTDGRVVMSEAPALTALNADLRDQFVDDCAKGLTRWNRALSGTGYELRLPHIGFNRRVGPFADHWVTPSGELVSESEWSAQSDAWLPTDVDRAHIASLMQPVREPGKFASWLTPPGKGINTKPVDFEYVKL